MRKKSYMKASPAEKALVGQALGDILACLRAQAMSYQTSHWQVKGDDYYGNHLLFMRLYESVGEQIDTLAEKMVGYLGSEAVDLETQMGLVVGYTSVWSETKCHFQRGLDSETDLQGLLSSAYEELKDLGVMTLGLDDWIMATSNDHESNEYLLQQALNRGISMRASGAPTAEDDFYDNPEKREVLEFAESGAISNDLEVTESAVKKVDLDVSKSEAITDTQEAPKTPEEIKEEVGGEDLSTLNRFVVDSEDPDAAQAAKVNESRMAAWLSRGLII